MSTTEHVFVVEYITSAGSLVHSIHLTEEKANEFCRQANDTERSKHSFFNVYKFPLDTPKAWNVAEDLMSD